MNSNSHGNSGSDFVAQKPMTFRVWDQGAITATDRI